MEDSLLRICKYYLFFEGLRIVAKGNWENHGHS